MTTSVQETRERVQAYLTSAGRIEIDSDGDFTFQEGSARVFVGVAEHPNGDATIVRVFGLMVTGAKLSPELYEYVALNTDNWVFGHIALHPDDKGTATIVFCTRLLGDFLDKDELMYAVFGIANTADQLDDELAARFGGSVFHP